MATVVSVSELKRKFGVLKWDIDTGDIPTQLSQAQIAASELSAYLDCMIASPGGMNDASIAGCSTTSAVKLTGFFRQQALAAT